MELRVVFSEDPAFVLSRAGVFLSSQPVLHNMVLSILHARIAQGDPGRYWMAIQREDVVGVVLQSPLTFPATLTPMEPPVATAMADAIADAGIPLSGVNGEAATAAIFSGQWSERSKSAATPFQGNRLYELLEDREVPDIEGTLRQAGPKERSLMILWSRAFQHEIGESVDDIRTACGSRVGGRTTVVVGSKRRSGFYGSCPRAGRWSSPPVRRLYAP